MRTAKIVVQQPTHTVVALVVAALVFTLAVWLPNWKLVFQMLSPGDIAITDRVAVLWSLYGSIGTNFTLLSASYTVAIAVLFGINVSLLWYYIKKLRKNAKAGGSVAVGAGGLASGIFGIGCAACGTFILSSVLGLIGAAGILTFLPLGGEEFGILGVALIGYSVYATSQNIHKPLTCDA